MEKESGIQNDSSHNSHATTSNLRAKAPNYISKDGFGP